MTTFLICAALTAFILCASVWLFTIVPIVRFYREIWLMVKPYVPQLKANLEAQLKDIEILNGDEPEKVDLRAQIRAEIAAARAEEFNESLTS